MREIFVDAPLDLGKNALNRLLSDLRARDVEVSAARHLLQDQLHVDRTLGTGGNIGGRIDLDERERRLYLVDREHLVRRLRRDGLDVRLDFRTGGDDQAAVVKRRRRQRFRDGEIRLVIFAEKVGQPVDKRKISLDSPIKAHGTYQITVKLYEGIEGKFTVSVEG